MNSSSFSTSSVCWPQVGGGAFVVHGGFRELDRIADEIDRAGARQGMRHRHLHAAAEHLRIGEDLTDIVDRTDRHAELSPDPSIQ
jgi:hypothetical protein